MKYAVVEAGGKQYVAREGETLEVDRMPLEAGQTVEFKDVLLVVDGKQTQVGTPYVSGAKVKAEVVEEFKAPKVIVFKYIPKERYRRKMGHRQRYTRVRVNSIAVAAPRKKSAAKDEAAKPRETKKAPAAKASAAKGKAGAKASTKAKTTAKGRASGKATSTKSKSSGKAKGSSKPKKAE